MGSNGIDGSALRQAAFPAPSEIGKTGAYSLFAGEPSFFLNWKAREIRMHS
jgi:hypothetical protein